MKELDIVRNELLKVGLDIDNPEHLDKITDDLAEIIESYPIERQLQLAAKLEKISKKK